MSNVLTIRAGDIKVSEVHLRDVDQNGERYKGLVASVRKHNGLWGNGTGLTCRRYDDPTTGKSVVELIDGLHRLTAAKEVLGEDAELTVTVDDKVSQEEALIRQFSANFHRIETTPVQFGRHIVQYMVLKPLATIPEIAAEFGVTTEYINTRLGIVKGVKDESILRLVDDGKISATSAAQLAKLPEAEQADMVGKAMEMPAATFVPEVQKRLKELRTSAIQAREATVPTFEPVVKARTPGELKAAHGNEAVVKGVLESSGIVPTPEAIAGALAFAAYAVNADPASVAEQKAIWDRQQAEIAEKKKQREAEKAAKAQSKAPTEAQG